MFGCDQCHNTGFVPTTTTAWRHVSPRDNSCTWTKGCTIVRSKCDLQSDRYPVRGRHLLPRDLWRTPQLWLGYLFTPYTCCPSLARELATVQSPTVPRVRQQGTHSSSSCSGPESNPPHRAGTSRIHAKPLQARAAPPGKQRRLAGTRGAGRGTSLSAAVAGVKINNKCTTSSINEPFAKVEKSHAPIFCLVISERGDCQRRE